MTFAEYCQQNSATILEKILEFLPEREPLGHYRVAREYTLRKGKYARPNLALLWAELFGSSKEAVFPFACGIQMAEDWFLMQDDWMDQNEVRRGKPAAHLLYGASATINASNSVQAAMWKVVHEGTREISPSPSLSRGETTTRLFDKFYDIINVTIEGQYLDLKLTERKVTDFTLDDYWQSIHAKAAYYSVYGPMQLGAIAAEQPEETVTKIANYGEKIGRAFQLKDDILDCVSTEKTLGKTIGNDILEGTKTAILWHFLQKADASDRKMVEEIYTKKRTEKTPKDVKTVLDLFVNTGSIAFAEQLSKKLYNEGAFEFEQSLENLPNNIFYETAKDAIRQIVKRDK